jgi:hypothetical protein
VTVKTRIVKTCVLGFLVSLNSPARAAETVQKTEPAEKRIGIYDSRIVGYAFFWSAQHQQQLAERVKAAKAAQAAGDTAQFSKLDRELAEDQKTLHSQVFSTAPIPQALDALKDRIPRYTKGGKCFCPDFQVGSGSPCGASRRKTS